jgi:Group II intron, maturase-specific domain./Reverse transcriptase (RNA-dependent DNA polymerase)./HNH endonuclease.
MEDGKFRCPTSGTPQGGIVSPLLANIYLHELDRWAGQFTHLPKLKRDRRRRRGKGNWRYIRYADDFLLLTNGSRKNAEAMKEKVSDYLSDQLNLTLSSEKTTVVHANDGFDFLGYHLQRKKDGRGGKVAKWTIPKSAKEEFKDKIRAATAGNPDVSVRAKIRALNRIIRGWSSYYRYATDASKTFSNLDYFVWERLAGWLATKYRSPVSEVWKNRLDGSSPIKINGRSIVQMHGRSTVYGETHIKEGHPYLTDAEWERESLPQGTYWLSNVEERNGWRDQRWKALERDEWTCQSCGTDLEKEEPRVHHRRSRNGYDNEEEADRLGNLVSLCSSCHHQVEANR